MKLRLSVFFGLAGLAFVMFSGCGSSNYNGIYSGSCTGCQSSNITMTLYEQGNNVTGEWSGTNTGGSFSGSANGSSINNCTFTVGGTTTSQGTLTLNGSTLSGSCGNVTVNLTQSQ